MTPMTDEYEIPNPCTSRRTDSKHCLGEGSAEGVVGRISVAD